MVDAAGGAFFLVWLLWLAASLAVGAILIWVAVKIVRMAWYGGAPPPPPGSQSPGVDPALQILRERYARGEISLEEFEERRRQLGL